MGYRAAWIGAIALLALTVLGRGMVAFAPAEDPRSQAVLAKMAARTNKNLPISVDKETELVATEGLSGVFSYTYRLVNITASEVDSGKMLATLKQQTVKLVCGVSAGPDFPVSRCVFPI